MTHTTQDRTPDTDGDAPESAVVGPVVDGELVDEDIPAPPARRATQTVVDGWFAVRTVGVWRMASVTATGAACVPIGTARLTAMAWRWIRADDYRHALVTDPRFVETVRTRRRRTAWVLVAVAVSAAGVGTLILGPAAPAGMAATVAALGTGTEARRRMAASGARLALPGRKGTPAESVVTRAAAAAKLGASTDPERYRLARPVASSDEGWSTVLQLPEGAKARKALGREGEFASALGVAETSVFFDLDPGHAGRLSVYVAKGDPFLRVHVSPLVGRTDPVDIWQGIPVGVDGRGRHVPLRLVDASLLVAGEPRAGKTVATNTVIAAFALAVTPRIHLFDGKGAGDHRPWRRIAHTAVKISPGRLVEHLRAMVAEMERRFDALDRHGRGTKLTGQLCRELGFDVELTVVDETRYYTNDKEHGEEIVNLAIDIASRGPAAGMVLLLATQRMTVDAIPGPLKGVCSLRWAMRCPDPTASNAVLGQGAAGKGYDASEIPRSHRGVGILDADGEDPVMNRSLLLDDDALAEIADTAYVLREAAGTLPGGTGERVERVETEQPDETQIGLLHHLVDVFGDEERLWLDEILDRIDTDRYPVRTKDELTMMMKINSVGASRQVWRHGRNRQGYHRGDVEAALEAARGVA